MTFPCRGPCSPAPATMPGGPTSPARSRRSPAVLVASQRIRHSPQQVHDPRAPPGGDVVVEPDHIAFPDGRELIPAGPGRHGTGALCAADRVGEEDVAGIDLENRLC